MDLKQRLAKLSPAQRRAFLQKLKQNQAAPATPNLPRRPASVKVPPLSASQRRMWFLSHWEDASAYNMPSGMQFRGPLDIRAFVQAIQTVILRHEVFRYRILSIEGNPQLELAETVQAPFQILDFSKLSQESQHASIQALAAAESQLVFDLTQAPLARFFLLRLDIHHHLLLTNMHHLISDGWSQGVFGREFMTVYGQVIQGEAPELPELNLQYGDVAHWLEQAPQQERLHDQKAYWLKALEDVPLQLDFPTRTDRDNDQPALEIIDFEVDQAIKDAMMHLQRETKTTSFMVLETVFALVLQRYSGQTTLTIGTPLAGRHHAGVSDVVGCFVNTAVLKHRFTETHHFRQALLETRKTFLEANAHQDLPFDQVVDAVHMERGADQQLFHALFVLQNTPPVAGTLAGLEVTPFERPHHRARFKLNMTVAETDKGFRGFLEFRRDLYQPALIQQFLQDVLDSLKNFVHQPEASLAKWHAMPLSKAQSWAQSAAALPENAPHSLAAAFAKITTAFPEKLAVIDGDEAYTYQQWDHLTDQFAANLSQAGVRHGSCVALLSDQRMPMAAAILAIAKLGATYLPLSSEDPPARWAFVLADAGADWLLSDRDEQDLALPKTCQTIPFSTCLQPNSTSFPKPSHAMQPAYVMYTSGSTGNPKGVAISQAGILRLALGGSYLPLERVRMLQAAPFSFDASTLELWGPLLNGGTCVLFPDRLPTPQSLRKVIQEKQVDALWLTASLFHLVVDVAPETLAGVRYLLAGGEALSRQHLNQALQQFPALTIINGYGPTENTTFTTVHPMGAADLPLSHVSLGRPIAETHIFVADLSGRLQPQGAFGELLIGGAGLAYGYWGRPALTAAQFVPDAFSGQPGARLYRSGDRVRFLEDGTLQFGGRIDRQVKLRGFRIELEEIANTLMSDERVAQAHVAISKRGGQKALHAFASLHSGSQPFALDHENPWQSRWDKYQADMEVQDLAKKLLARLATQLPAFMVPEQLYLGDALPMTRNAKVDAKALATWQASQTEHDLEQTEAMTDTETTILAVFQQVLGKQGIGLRDNFFDLGGQSLNAIEAVTRLSKTLSQEIPLATFFEHASARQLANALGRAVEPTTQLAPIRALEPAERYPLSFAQQRLWFLQELEPHSPFYNIFSAVALKGPLVSQAFQKALHDVVDRHEVLRTTFSKQGDTVMQVVHPVSSFAMATHDFTGLDQTTQDARLRSQMQASAQEVFDLEAGPLFRVTLLKMADQHHVLLLNLHHIVADGWSVTLFLRDMASFYAQACGEATALTPLPVQYRDYAAWQKTTFADHMLEAQRAFWRKQLQAPLSASELFTDRSRPAVKSLEGNSIDFQLSSQAQEQLIHWRTTYQTTPYVAALAAFKVLVQRYTQQADVVIGGAVANRSRPEVQDLIGFFVNTLVLRTEISDELTLGAAISRVKETVTQALIHQDVPFDELVAEYQSDRDPSRTPLFQIMFAYNASQETPKLGNLELQGLPLENTTAKFDLLLTIEERDGHFTGNLNYDRHLFDQASMQALIDSYQNLLVQSDLHQRIAHLPLSHPDQHSQLLQTWSQRPAPPLSTESLHHSFERVALKNPHRTALVSGTVHLSYGHLNDQADLLAHQLRQQGIGLECGVAVSLPRSPELMIAILAILKTGGHYVPVDSKLPTERIAFLVKDSAAALILTTADLESIFADASIPVHVFQAGKPNAEKPAPPSSSKALPQSALAYVKYTSGSTGTPKGVAVSHQNVLRLALGNDFWQSEQAMRMLQVAPIGFDAATFEIWNAFLNGACLVLFAEEAITVQRAKTVIQQQKIETLWLTTSLFNVLVDEDANLFQGTKQVLTGGEVASLPRFKKALTTSPQTQFINCYGPTENTTFTTTHRVTQHDMCGAIPIGQPILHTQVYVLQEDLGPCPAGIPGELLTGGLGLSRGYLGRPRLTATQFIPHPFAENPGERLYKTGDLVSFGHDGILRFHQRMDQQIKLRGFRIEPEEIVQVLVEHPLVGQAAIIDRRQPHHHLAAYFTCRKDEPTNADLVPMLRQYLGERLPAYMVPEAWSRLDTLPLKANGKLDVSALPQAYTQEDTAYAAPKTATQQQLASIFQQVLGLEQVGLHLNFFQAGGHSLLATKAIARIRQQLGHELPLRWLFEAPTVGQLANRLDGATPQSQMPLVALEHRPDPLPLSFAQQRLWFLTQLNTADVSYNIPAVIQFDDPPCVETLTKAISTMVARHESLRTSFPQDEDGKPFQQIFTSSEVEVSEVQTSTDTLLSLIQERIAAPFDIAKGPLFRTTLLHRQEDSAMLLLVMHHLIADGWSMEVLTREAFTCYQTLLKDEAPEFPPLPVQYADFALWQRQFYAAEGFAEALSYWQEQLAGASGTLNLPKDRARPKTPSHRGAMVHFELDQALREQLNQCAAQTQTTLFMVLLTAFKVLLSRYSGQSDILVGTPVANRRHQEIEGLIGFFVNTLVLRSDLSENPSFQTLLQAVKETSLAAFAHQDLPFEQLIESLGSDRDLAHSPLFQVMFVLQNAGEKKQVSTDAFELPIESAKFDLTLFLTETQSGISASLNYATDLFDRPRMVRLTQHFQNVLRHLLAHPDQPINQACIMTRENLAVLRSNSTGPRQPLLEASLAGLFQACLQRQPDALALSHEGTSWSRAQLGLAAQTLAIRLEEHGLLAGEPVAIWATRQPETIVAILATLMAGGCYLAIDPQYPEGRIAHILRQAEPRFLLHQEPLSWEPPASVTSLTILDPAARVDNKHPRGGAGLLPAYVMFTSGSSGRPKGVAIQHQAVINLLQNLHCCVPSADQGMLKIALNGSLAFDTSVKQLFQLVRGHSLIFVPEDLRLDALALSQWLTKERIDVLDITPSQMVPLLEAFDQGECSQLPAIILVGGEPIEPHLWQRLAALPKSKCFNLYGPTETTVDVTVQAITNDQDQPKLGKPLGNTTIHILNRHGQLQPQTHPGELCIGGLGLGLGYWRQPALTAAAFRPHPWPATPGERLYHSGDLATYQTDHTLVHMGRVDHQVKIRGYRVETAGIEQLLLDQPGVQAAAVIAHQTQQATQLFAFVVLQQDIAEETLATRLEKDLPLALIPRIQTLEMLPVTVHGKLDREALYQRIADESPSIQFGQAPRSHGEHLLCDIWSDLLDTQVADIHANFFHLGGHSLMATQMMSRIRQAFMVTCPIRTIFEHATIAALAAFIDQAKGEHPPIDQALKPMPRPDKIPLSFAQQRLWVLQKAQPTSTFYSMPRAFTLHGEVDAEALKQALLALSQRHEILRTSFHGDSQETWQTIHQKVTPHFKFIDLMTMAEDERDQRVEAFIGAEIAKPFDLGIAPLWRVHAFQVGPQQLDVLFNMHHIISDGWSTGIIARELSTLYSVATHASEATLPPQPLQYADFSLWQNQQLSGAHLQDEIQWWREQLAGAPSSVALLADKPRPTAPSFPRRCGSSHLASFPYDPA